MKKLLFTFALLTGVFSTVSAQTYSGVLNHTNSYFTMHPYNDSNYDDGSFAKIFYDGNNKIINFWNSDRNTNFTNLKVGYLYAKGRIISVLNPGKTYVIAGKDNSNQFRIGYDGTGGVIESFLNNTHAGTHIKFNTGLVTRMTIKDNGKVGIGSANPDQKLTVKGAIHAEEVIVDLDVPADYVFEKYYLGQSALKTNYTMPTLEEVEAFTKANHHLPEMPSAKTIQEEGLKVKEMTNLLLQKVEELTLYTIEQEKRIKNLEAALIQAKK